MNKPVILIVDDEPQIRKLLEINLENSDYKVLQAETAKEGIRIAASHPPDLILLDLGLPDKDGLSVILELRLWYNRPIIVLSAFDDEEHIVQALDNGANDYLTKPFRTPELLARIRNALRSVSNSETSAVHVFGELEVDLSTRIVKNSGTIVHLTQTEFSMLVLFVQNAGKVLTHRFILREIWGPGYQTETQYLRVFVAQLRKKIEQDPSSPQHLLTESRVGYRFV